MNPSPESGELDSVLLCDCTMVTVGDMREACCTRQWPLPGKERTGKLCTGCMGDLLYCLRRFGVDGTVGIDTPAD